MFWWCEHRRRAAAQQYRGFLHLQHRPCGFHTVSIVHFQNLREKCARFGRSAIVGRAERVERHFPQQERFTGNVISQDNLMAVKQQVHISDAIHRVLCHTGLPDEGTRGQQDLIVTEQKLGLPGF